MSHEVTSESNVTMESHKCHTTSWNVTSCHTLEKCHTKEMYGGLSQDWGKMQAGIIMIQEK